MIWLIVAGVMLIAGTVFFGWRGVVIVGLTTAATMLSYVTIGLALRTASHRHIPIIGHYGFWLGMLLGLSMPVMFGPALPLLGGLALGAAAHLVGRDHRVRVHPVALVLVLVWLAPAAMHQAVGPFGMGPRAMRQMLNPPLEAVLRPNHLVIGDVADASPPPPDYSRRPWRDDAGFTDAVRRANLQLLLIRQQEYLLQDESRLVNMLRRNELPSMPTLLIGATPGPIGATSPALLIALGLFLMYRRLASWRTALAALAAAIVTYVLMPIGVGQKHTVVLDCLIAMGPAAAVTFMGYVILATPLPLIVLILAPAADPMSRAGRVVYGVLIGCGAMLAQWFLATPEAMFVSLVIAGVLSRPLDALHKSPFAR